MEKLKAKHDHKLTDILKVLIFAIFLMLPFMVYCPNALYYGHNEHSTNETQTTVDIQYKYQSNEVNSFNDIVVGNIYECNYLTLETGYDITMEVNILAYDTLFFNDLTDGVINEYLLPNYDSKDNNAIKVFIEDNSLYLSLTNLDTYITLYYEQTSLIFNGNVVFQIPNLEGWADYFELAFDFDEFDISYTNFNVIERVDVQENVEMTITESMNKAWQRMWQTPMFNWTNESVLKQSLDNFTGVFGVTDTSYFTNLIVYELIIVAIYIVIDIILTMFKWLTHLIGEK